jgi:hypothetical protein
MTFRDAEKAHEVLKQVSDRLEKDIAAAKGTAEAARLEKLLSNILMLDGRQTKEDRELILGKASEPGHIIITSLIAGRGTDYKLAEFNLTKDLLEELSVQDKDGKALEKLVGSQFGSQVGTVNEIRQILQNSEIDQARVNGAQSLIAKQVDSKEFAAVLARVSNVVAGKHGFKVERETEMAAIKAALKELTGQVMDWNMTEKLLKAQRIQDIENFFNEMKDRIGDDQAKQEKLETVKSRTYMRWVYGYQMIHEINKSDRVDGQIDGRVGRQDNPGTSIPIFSLAKDKNQTGAKNYSKDIADIAQKGIRQADQDSGIFRREQKANEKAFAAFLKVRDQWLKAQTKVEAAQKALNEARQRGDKQAALEALEAKVANALIEVEKLSAKLRTMLVGAKSQEVLTRAAELKKSIISGILLGIDKIENRFEKLKSLTQKVRSALTEVGSAQYNLDINDMKQRVRKDKIANPWFKEWRRVSGIASTLETPENANSAANITSEVVEAIFKTKDIQEVGALIRSILGVSEINGISESRREALKARITSMIASGQIKITDKAFKEAVDLVKMDFVDNAQKLESNPETYKEELTKLGQKTESDMRKNLIEAIIAKNTPVVEKGSVSEDAQKKAMSRWAQSYEQGRIEAYAKETGAKPDSAFMQAAKRAITGVKSLYERTLDAFGRAPALDEVYKGISKEESTRLIEESQNVNSGAGAVVEVRKTQELITREETAEKVTIDLGELTAEEKAQKAVRPEAEVNALKALESYAQEASTSSRTEKTVEMTINGKAQNIVMNLGGGAAKDLANVEAREALLNAIMSGKDYTEINGNTIIIAKNTNIVDGIQSNEIHIMDDANLDVRTLAKETAAAKKAGLDIKYSFTKNGVNILIGRNEITDKVWINGSGNIFVNAKLREGIIESKNIIRNTTAKTLLISGDAVVENVVAETLDLAKGSRAKDIAANKVELGENAVGEFLGSVGTEEIKLGSHDIRRSFYKDGELLTRSGNIDKIKEKLADNPAEITIMEEKAKGQPSPVKVAARSAIAWLKGNEYLGWMVPKSKAEKTQEMAKKDKELEKNMRESIAKAAQLPYEVWHPDTVSEVLEVIKDKLSVDEVKAYQESPNTALAMAQDAESILNSSQSTAEEIAKAKVIVAASLRIDPKESTANRLTGDMLIKQAEKAEGKEAKALKEQALAHYEASYKVDSTDREALNGVVKTALEVGQNTIALDAAKAGAKEFGDKASRLLLGRTLIKTGSEAEGIKLVAKAEGIASGTVKKYMASVEASKQIQAKEQEKQQMMFQKMMMGQMPEEQKAAKSAELEAKEKALTEEINTLRQTLTQQGLTIAETIQLSQATDTAVASKLIANLKDENLNALKSYVNEYKALKDIPITALAEGIQKDASSLNILKVFSETVQKTSVSAKDKASSEALVKEVKALEASFNEVRGAANKLEELLKTSQAEVGIIQMLEAISQAAQTVHMIQAMPERDRSIMKQMITEKGSKIANQTLWSQWLSAADGVNFGILMKDMAEQPGFTRFSAVLDIPEQRQILNSLVPQLAVAASKQTASEVTDESLSATST